MQGLGVKSGMGHEIKVNHQILQLIFFMILRDNYSSCFLFAGHESPGPDATHCQDADETSQNIFLPAVDGGSGMPSFS